METGFLNCYDEEHFSTLSPSMIYDDQGEMLDDSEGSLLDMIPVDFYNSRVARPDPWGQDHEQELNGDIALLPGPISSSGQSHRMEDYHKTLTDWQEHIGTLQNSDNDEMEIKGIFEEMDVVLAAYTEEDSTQEAMFDETSFDADSANKKLDKTATKKVKSLGIGKNLVGKDLPLGHFIKEEVDDIDNFAADGENSTALDDGFAITKFEMLDETNNLEDDFRIDADDDCIDVETVANSEQMPVLEAGDLTSLLEQFEASETVNSSTNMGQKHTQVDRQPQIPPRMPQQPKISPTKPVVVMTHQNIRDALPKEVIERIKACSRKKAVPLIPAMPTKKPRGGTRMQDAGAALSRNKLLKIVSGSVSGESIQLDHDYCSASKHQPSESASVPPRSFYHSNASDYGSQDRNTPSANDKVYSRLPDYVVPLAKQNSSSTSGEDSRRDSGLESGDASDASEELSDKSNLKVVGSGNLIKTSVSNSDSSRSDENVATKSSDKIITICGKSHNVGSIMETWNKTFAKVQNVPQISLPKKPLVSVLRKTPATVDNVVSVNRVAEVSIKVEVKSNDDEKETKKRKKLNILEYRSRVKELDRCQDSCDTTRSNSPLTPDSASLEEAQMLFDQATKLLMNCKGKFDDKTSAIITQTLKDQAAISLLSHKMQDVKHIHEKTIWVPPEEITLVEMAIEDEDEGVAKEVDGTLDASSSSEQMQVEKSVPPPPAVAETVETEPAVTDPEPTPDTKEAASDSSEGTSTNHDRSRRQYRSRRADSSCSSSPNPTETSSRDRRCSDDRKRRSSNRSPGRSRPNKRQQSDRHADRHRRDGRRSDQSPDRSRAKKRRSDWSPESVGHEKRRSDWSPRTHRTVSKSPSPSESSRSTCSSYSSQSRSSSRNKSRDWQIERSTRIDYDRNRRSESIHSYRSNRSRTSNRSWRSSYRNYRSRSPLTPNHGRSPMIQFTNEEKQRQVEERRVIYVGQIEETMSKAKLRELFEAFGHIVDISVHFREHGDNYGFVTYALKEDAYKAVENGKRDPTVNKYELSFGGRRAFCKTRYSDLDGQRDEDELMMPYQPLRTPLPPRPKLQSNNFDLLMKEAKARILKRKP